MAMLVQDPRRVVPARGGGDSRPPSLRSAGDPGHARRGRQRTISPGSMRRRARHSLRLILLRLGLLLGTGPHQLGDNRPKLGRRNRIGGGAIDAGNVQADCAAVEIQERAAALLGLEHDAVRSRRGNRSSACSANRPPNSRPTTSRSPCCWPAWASSPRPRDRRRPSGPARCASPPADIVARLVSQELDQLGALASVLPSTAVMASPFLSPALSAGPPGATASIVAVAAC